ncbi:MAG: hypothetical protein AUK32_04215 [Candidatus Aquicultor secundus]|nr:TasA family protein [Candidatus Aquicultor secundus]NCO66693.1 hypothetical protein [Solirubrobacter sp.]OIO87172.1 MAG: hypothetical protein AUK32_04215 [Candidatus Aquicultor secundus]
MKKLMIALVGIMLVLTMLTGGTFSYMTAEAENMDNTITTGSMCLGTDPEPFMTIADLMPGSPPQEATLTVFSGKDTKFFYKVKSYRETGTSTKLWNAAMVEVEDMESGDTWTGNLNILETDWLARENGVEGGGPENGHVVSFKVWIPQEADVDDESTATVKFRFDAEQWRPVTP